MLSRPGCGSRVGKPVAVGPRPSRNRIAVGCRAQRGGGIAVQRGDLPPLVSPGLVQRVVADDPRDRGEGPRDPTEHGEVARADAVRIGVEVGERAVHARVRQLEEGPDLATAVVGRVRRGAGRDGPQGEAGAEAVAEGAGEAILVDVDDHVEPACPGRRGDGDQPRQIRLVVAARLRLVRLPDEGEADRIEAEFGQPVEHDRVVRRGEGREFAVAAEVDPAEQDDAAIRADEVPPLDAEHGRVRGVASQGRADADRAAAADSPCGRLVTRQAPQTSRNKAEITPRAAGRRPVSSRMGIGEGRSI